LVKNTQRGDRQESLPSDPIHEVILMTAVCYEIRVEGVLDTRWASWFCGLQIRGADTQTVISGPLVDQAALHGVLAKVRDLGLVLSSVRRLGPDEPEANSCDPNQ
jgi:hypothetical protein